MTELLPFCSGSRSAPVGTNRSLPILSLGVSRGQPLAAAPAFLGGDPTVAHGAPPAPGAADSLDGRPRPMAVTHLDEAGDPIYIH